MSTHLNARQLTGRDESHLVSLPCGNQLHAEAAAAFAALQADASEAGFCLTVASSFRSFSRQLALWNGKACGERAVHDDEGCTIDLSCLPPLQQIHAILRFSALPGASRHHWGTDLDVFDASAVDDGYQLALSPQEVVPGGVFDALHCWLDEQMAAGDSHGFYRPYHTDRGGVAPERWHLSYVPLAGVCAQRMSSSLLRDSWGEAEVAGEILLRAEVEANLEQIYARYVSVPDDGWAGALG